MAGSFFKLIDNLSGTDLARSTLWFRRPHRIDHQDVRDRYGFWTRGDGWGELLHNLQVQSSARYRVMQRALYRYQMNRLFPLRLSTTMDQDRQPGLRRRSRYLCPT